MPTFDAESVRSFEQTRERINGNRLQDIWMQRIEEALRPKLSDWRGGDKREHDCYSIRRDGSLQCLVRQLFAYCAFDDAGQLHPR
jgi:hypothetical protein